MISMVKNEDAPGRTEIDSKEIDDRDGDADVDWNGGSSRPLKYPRAPISSIKTTSKDMFLRITILIDTTSLP